MSLTTPPSVVIPFANDATVATITNPIPVPSQVGIVNGAASYSDGFPLATMVDPETEGGVPPFGQDFNGILFAITAHIAWVAAGGTYEYNADVATLATGYSVGAIIRSAANPESFFYNTLADNPNDPDSVTTGWIQFSPLSNPTGSLTTNPAAGTYNDVAMERACGFYNVDTTAGNVTITGFDGAGDGQIITVSNTGPNLLTLSALTGSVAANQFRFPADLSLVQYQSLTVRYSDAIGKFVAY